jgi:uncharacterized protein YcaQ
VAQTSATYPLHAARALALHTQCLTSRPKAPTQDSILAIIEQLGCIQIDTLQVVQRAHYLTLWSRLGNYDTENLDRLIYSPVDRQLFEYWYHAASIIPLTSYRYFMPQMSWFREGNSRWYQEWIAKPGSARLMEAVAERIRREGPLRAADFKHDGEQRGAWWDWKPAKHALEQLYNRGDLMITNRVSFQRVYDLTERVLPNWVDPSELTRNEAHRHMIEHAVKALGVCQPLQAAEYTWMRRGTARPHVKALIEEGVFIPVQVVLADGGAYELIIHRDNSPLLAKAADGDLKAECTTFLNPFDSLFWAKDRDMQFWNFRQTLEAYKPETQRIWGYFCLPILHCDRLVGRFDPKLDRKTGTLFLKRLYLEPGIGPDDRLVSGIANTMRDFLAFHDANDMIVEHSEPPEFGANVLQAL